MIILYDFIMLLKFYIIFTVMFIIFKFLFNFMGIFRMADDFMIFSKSAYRI